MCTNKCGINGDKAGRHEEEEEREERADMGSGPHFRFRRDETGKHRLRQRILLSKLFVHYRFRIHCFCIAVSLSCA